MPVGLPIPLVWPVSDGRYQYPWYRYHNGGEESPRSQYRLIAVMPVPIPAWYIISGTCRTTITFTAPFLIGPVILRSNKCERKYLERGASIRWKHSRGSAYSNDTWKTETGIRRDVSRSGSARRKPPYRSCWWWYWMRNSGCLLLCWKYYLIIH